jgi:glutaminyl-tRNA synthetase
VNPTQESTRPARDDEGASRDFIRALVAEDLRTGKHGGRVITRFPPEPNGYLHIGHAKAISLDFGVATEFGGRCHLRMDDTNPETEDIEYVEAILRDVRWLGFDWGEHLYFASDYFERFYNLAEGLIRKGLAYVDSHSEDQIRENRGTVTQPGRPGHFRNRSVDENLDLFRRMRAGEFPDGAHVLRAKIDLASPNMLMRDPVLYRIRHATHYRRGDAWCIYPLYDYAHPLEDALECVTHSLCTLEFENNRELYDWVVENCDVSCRPGQTEFARLALDYTVVSKRKLLKLVEGGYVRGWDDPRMPTLAGLRRRGVTPESILAFCEMVGVARTNSRVDIAKFEFAVREDLNTRAPRVMCVLRPLRVVLTNYPDDVTESFDVPHWPHDVPKEGTRAVPFSGTLWIERDDFAEEPPKGFHRLAPGREVRLRAAYIIRCDEVVKDAAGEIVELRCTYDPETRGGTTPDGRTVKGTLHWVSERDAVNCEVRLYDRLFTTPDPEAGEDGDADFLRNVNPDSLEVIADARIEPAAANLETGSHVQFERLGFFVVDADARPGSPVFNRTVMLRDTWARVSGRETESAGRPDRSRPRREPAASPATRLAHRQDADGGVPSDLTTRDENAGRLLDEAVAAGAEPIAAANWINNDLARELAGASAARLRFGGAQLARLLRMLTDGALSSSAAREVLAELVRNGGDPETIVKAKGLQQINDHDAILRVVERVLAANPAKVAEYRAGRDGLLGFFVGQVMAQSQGRANPERAKTVLREQLAQPHNA